jgi:type I restriction enzyme S subunit
LFLTDRISALAGSITFKEVNRSALRDFEIPLPPISEQRRIVELMEQADMLRKRRTEANITFAHFLPTLFSKTFGDPATNPKAWPTVPLEEVVEIGTQLVDPTQPEYGDLIHIGGEQIEKETGRVLSPVTVRDSELRSSKFVFGKEHILYCKIRPYLNKVAYPQLKGLCSADIYPLRIRDSRLGPWYLIALLRSRAFLDYAKLHSARLRMPKLNREQLGMYGIPIPDPQLMTAFESRAEKIAGLEAHRFRAADLIEALFRTILQGAFTAELTATWRRVHRAQLLTEIEQQAKIFHFSKEALLC